jgi:hypothetical protein
MKKGTMTPWTYINMKNFCDRCSGTLTTCPKCGGSGWHEVPPKTPKQLAFDRLHKTFGSYYLLRFEQTAILTNTKALIYTSLKDLINDDTVFTLEFVDTFEEGLERIER